MPSLLQDFFQPTTPSLLPDVAYAFLSILLEGTPYILFGTLLSGFIAAFLDSRLLDRLLPKNGLLATLIAGLLGLVFPVCECAIVPVIRRLVQKGLPLSCAVTYMLAAPIVNPIVAFSTLTAFNELPGLNSFSALTASITFARLSLGYTVAVAVGIGLLFIRRERILSSSVLAGLEKSASHSEVTPATAASFNAKLVQAMRTAMSDFLDTAMYFTIGVIITAVFKTQVDHTQLSQMAGQPWLAQPFMMGLAMVLSLCSTTDAFIAASMAGFSTAAKLAFMVFGPMMDIKLLFMYSSIFQRRIVVSLMLVLFILVGLLSQPWLWLIQG
jgi:uncharacterized protein